MKKTLRISFNGKTYDVVAELLGDEAAGGRGAPAPVAAAPIANAPLAAASTPRPVAGGAGEIASPLAGKVVSINAGVGTTVKAGQPVITLEAMKMNTIVSSTSDGTVAAVHVTPGDSVEEGQPLLTLR